MAGAVGDKGLLNKLYEVRYDGRPVEFLLFLIGIVRSQVREDEVDKLELKVRLYKYLPQVSTAIFNIDFRKLCSSLAELRGDPMTESDIQRRFFAKIIATTTSFDFIMELNEMGRRMKWSGERGQEKFHSLIQSMDDWLARQGKLVTRTVSAPGGRSVHVAFYSGLQMVPGSVSPEEAMCAVLDGDPLWSDQRWAGSKCCDRLEECDFAAIVQFGLGSGVDNYDAILPPSASSGSATQPASSGGGGDLVLVVASSTGMSRFPDAHFAGARGRALKTILLLDNKFKMESERARPGQTPRKCYLRHFAYTADHKTCAIVQCEESHFRIDHPNVQQLVDRVLGAPHDSMHTCNLVTAGPGREAVLKSKSGRHTGHVVLLNAEEAVALYSPQQYADLPQVFGDEAKEAGVPQEEALFASHVLEDGHEDLSIGFGDRANVVFPAVEIAGAGTPVAAAGAGSGGLKRVRRPGASTGVAPECDPKAGFSFDEMLRLNQLRNDKERFEAAVAASPRPIHGDPKGLSFGRSAADQSMPDVPAVQRAPGATSVYTGLSMSPAGPPAHRARYHGSSSSDSSDSDGASASPQLTGHALQEESKGGEDSCQLSLTPPPAAAGSSESDSDVENSLQSFGSSASSDGPSGPVGASLGGFDICAQVDVTPTAADIEEWCSEPHVDAPDAVPARPHWALRWALLVVLVASLEYSSGWRTDNNSAERLELLVLHMSMGSVNWEVMWACLYELVCSLVWELGAEITEVFHGVSGSDVTTTGVAICGSTWHACTSVIHFACALALGLFFSLRQRGLRTVVLLYLAGRHAAGAAVPSGVVGEASGGEMSYASYASHVADLNTANGLLYASDESHAAVTASERATVHVASALTVVVLLVSYAGAKSSWEWARYLFCGAKTCWECARCMFCSLLGVLSAWARALGASSGARPETGAGEVALGQAVVHDESAEEGGSDLEITNTALDSLSDQVRAAVQHAEAECRSVNATQGTQQKVVDELGQAVQDIAEHMGGVLKTQRKAVDELAQAWAMINSHNARLLQADQRLNEQWARLNEQWARSEQHEQWARSEQLSQEHAANARRSDGHGQSSAGSDLEVAQALQSAQEALEKAQVLQECKDKMMARELSHGAGNQTLAQQRELVDADTALAQQLAEKDAQEAVAKQASLQASVALRRRERAAIVRRDRAIAEAEARFQTESTGAPTEYVQAAAHAQEAEQCEQVQRQVQRPPALSAESACAAAGGQGPASIAARTILVRNETVSLQFKSIVNCLVESEGATKTQHELARRVAKAGATVHYFQLNPEGGLVFPTVAVNECVIGDSTGMFGSGDPECPDSFESFHKSQAGGCWLAFDYSASYSQGSGGKCDFTEHGVPHVDTFGRSSLGWFPVYNQRFWKVGSKDPHYNDATILVISPVGGALPGEEGDTEWKFGDGESAVNLGTKAPYLLLVLPHWTPPCDFTASYLRHIVELYYTHHGCTPQHMLPGGVRSFDVWTWDLTKYFRQGRPVPSGSSMGKAGGGKGMLPGATGKGGGKGLLPGATGKGRGVQGKGERGARPKGGF
jgi:hypothetical protein